MGWRSYTVKIEKHKTIKVKDKFTEATTEPCSCVPDTVVSSNPSSRSSMPFMSSTHGRRGNGFVRSKSGRLNRALTRPSVDPRFRVRRIDEIAVDPSGSTSVFTGVIVLQSFPLALHLFFSPSPTRTVSASGPTVRVEAVAERYTGERYGVDGLPVPSGEEGPLIPQVTVTDTLSVQISSLRCLQSREEVGEWFCVPVTLVTTPNTERVPTDRSPRTYPNLGQT